MAVNVSLVYMYIVCTVTELVNIQAHSSWKLLNNDIPRLHACSAVHWLSVHSLLAAWLSVLLSTGCLSIRCPLAICPAVYWLSVLLFTGCLFVRCPLTVCLSCCPLAVRAVCTLSTGSYVCLFVVHWLSVRSLSTVCLSIRCPLAVCPFAVHW